MPVYEYRCQDCGKVSSFFIRSIGAPLEPVCAHCHSQNLRRRMSSFATGKTTQSVHDSHTSPSDPGYYSDPRNIGRHVESSFKRYGMEMPAQVRETIEAAREGNLPKEINP